MNKLPWWMGIAMGVAFFVVVDVLVSRLERAADEHDQQERAAQEQSCKDVPGVQTSYGCFPLRKKP